MLCNRDMSGFCQLEELGEQMFEVQSKQQYHQEAIASATDELSKITTRFNNRNNNFYVHNNLEYLQAEIRLLKSIRQHHMEAITFVKVEFQRLKVLRAGYQHAEYMRNAN